MRWLLALLGAVALQAGDVTGTWTGHVELRKGQAQDFAIKLVQSGSGVTGKVYGDYTSSPIAEGRVNGDEVAFIVLVPEQGGNQINDTRYRFSGVVKEGKLELTRVREGATNAGNKGDVQFKGESKVTFQLKRLY